MGMAENWRIMQIIINGVKTAVFEKGTLIYKLNIPSFRKSRKAIEAKPKNKKIRIAFFLQCPENWEVIRSVYQAAQSDEGIETAVVLIPDIELTHYVKLSNVKW